MDSVDASSDAEHETTNDSFDYDDMDPLMNAKGGDHHHGDAAGGTKEESQFAMESDGDPLLCKRDPSQMSKVLKRHFGDYKIPYYVYVTDTGPLLQPGSSPTIYGPCQGLWVYSQMGLPTNYIIM